MTSAPSQSALTGGGCITRAAGPFSPLSAPSLCGSRPGTGENPGRGNQPSLSGLSAVQVRLLFFIAGFQAAHDGVSPRMVDMARAVGFAARSGPHRHLVVLEKRGWLRRVRAKACAIKLLAMPVIHDDAGADWLFVPGDCLAFHGGEHG